MKSDFVSIELSAAGVAFAGESKTLKIANGHFAYIFTPGSSVRVLTSEWNRVISKEQYQGQPIFQIAETNKDAQEGK